MAVPMQEMLLVLAFVCYDIIMKRASDTTFEMTEDFLCQGCCHYRPDWKYRFCEFLECPYVKGQKTFWEEVMQDAK